MIESVLNLSVPQTNTGRKQIREKVDAFFVDKNVVPPASYDMLYQYASELCETHNWQSSDFAFVMLCCGNAIWRPVMNAIPFERRVLLLPECLKNITKCKAEHDEFGLLCNNCGACSIGGMLEYAEELGYIALVSEGTTITTKLIESGKVDAVIGVGCMNVLQRMFDSVTKYAIPGLGVPLLADGCKSTEFDVDWLKREISEFNSNSEYRVLNTQSIKDKVQQFFDDETVRQVTKQGDSKTEEIAREALLTSGQRWRPFLTALVYEAICEKTDNQLFSKLAISVECFHKASLVHDDIEDGDTHRNGHETIHESYGTAIALNVGDMLIGEGYKILSQANLKPEALLACIQIASAGHIALTLGQGEELNISSRNEIPSTDSVINIFENKTSAAFRVSILIGAVAANASLEVQRQLDEFSKHIGIAYQIKDDLEDYLGGNGDIYNQRVSIVLSELFERLSEEEQINAYGLIEQKDNKIFELLKNKDVEALTRKRLKQHIDLALQSISTLDILRLKVALHEIMGKIFGKFM